MLISLLYCTVVVCYRSLYNHSDWKIDVLFCATNLDVNPPIQSVKIQAPIAAWGINMMI
jgi:hypothetical protein